MQIRFMLCAVVFSSVLALRAEEKIPLLRAGIDTYTNVTVTSVSATDIFFPHSRGVGNAKLKDLSPELQKKFHYDAAKGNAAEGQQTAANAESHKQAAAQKPPPPRPAALAETAESPATTD